MVPSMEISVDMPTSNAPRISLESSSEKVLSAMPPFAMGFGVMGKFSSLSPDMMLKRNIHHVIIYYDL